MWLSSTFSLVSPWQSWHLGHSGSIKTQPRTPADGLGLVSRAQIAASCTWFCILLAVLGMSSYEICPSAARWLFLMHLQELFSSIPSRLSSVNLMSIFSILLDSLLIKILKTDPCKTSLNIFFPFDANHWKLISESVSFNCLCTTL